MSRVKKLRTALLPFFAGTAAVLFVWQCIVWMKLKPTSDIPSPWMVFDALRDLWREGVMLGAVWNSLHRGVLGFLLSIAIATPVGLLVALVKPVRAFVRPILSALQQLPSVSWVPISIVLFGTSSTTVYAIILLGAVPSIANSLVSGIDLVPPSQMRAARMLGLRGVRSVRQVVLPAAMPGYLTGLEQGWAFAWRSLMAAELIATTGDLGSGLGNILTEGRNSQNMSLMLAGVALVLASGLLVEKAGFSPLRRRILSTRGLAVA
jgi:NitT/TauT family transport system permease protein